MHYIVAKFFLFQNNWITSNVWLHTRQVTFVKNHQTSQETSNMTKIFSQSLKKLKYYSNTTKFSDFDAFKFASMSFYRFWGCLNEAFKDVYVILGVLALFLFILVFLLKFVLKIKYFFLSLLKF